MSKKVVILVEDDLYKMKDMLLSIQSILFVATKKKIPNAPTKSDTEICLIHVIDNKEKEDSETFEGFKLILENRQHDSMGECKIKYSYEAVHINKDLYPPEDLDTSECKKIVCEKINKIKGNRDYSILLDVILVKKDDKEINQVLKGKKILSHALYQEYEEHCIPYTSYDENTQTFRKMWKEVIKGKQPRERSTLDGNVINKGFKQEIYGQLKIGV